MSRASPRQVAVRVFLQVFLFCLHRGDENARSPPPRLSPRKTRPPPRPSLFQTTHVNKERALNAPGTAGAAVAVCVCSVDAVGTGSEDAAAVPQGLVSGSGVPLPTKEPGWVSGRSPSTSIPAVSRARCAGGMTRRLHPRRLQILQGPPAGLRRLLWRPRAGGEETRFEISCVTSVCLLAPLVQTRRSPSYQRAPCRGRGAGPQSRDLRARPVPRRLRGDPASPKGFAACRPGREGGPSPMV